MAVQKLPPSRHRHRAGDTGYHHQPTHVCHGQSQPIVKEQIEERSKQPSRKPERRAKREKPHQRFLLPNQLELRLHIQCPLRPHPCSRSTDAVLGKNGYRSQSNRQCHQSLKPNHRTNLRHPRERSPGEKQKHHHRELDQSIAPPKILASQLTRHPLLNPRSPRHAHQGLKQSRQRENH